METCKTMIGSLLAVATLCALGLALLPVHAAPPTLPPRPPTATPVPPLPKAAPTGALIVLELVFGDDWPARGLAWQDLWTAVEWQDEDGAWHAVEGWQGGPDKVAGNVGWKTWWLTNDLLGRGPFRWVVYERQGGAAMAISDPFNLPDTCGQTVPVEVSLAP